MSDAWVALAGTVVGAGSSYAFQRLTQGRTERISRLERMRTEMLTSFSELARDLLDYRRAQLRRCHLALQGASTQSIEEAITDAQRCRAEAWSAFLRVKLVTDNAALGQLGYSILTQLRDLKDVSRGQELDALGDRIRLDVDRFIEAGRALLPR